MGGKKGHNGAFAKEQTLALAAGLDYCGVAAAGLSRRFPRIILDILVNLSGVYEAKKILSHFAPQAVIGTGGYAMAPSLRAAVSLHIPTLLHEQNVYPGWANRYLAGKVDVICLSFAAARPFFPARAHLIVSGMPVRQEIMNTGRQEAYEFFGIKEKNMPTLLVTGGSQGAKRLNEAVCGCYAQLLSAGLRIIHLTGEAHYNNCLNAAAGLKQENLYILPYLEEMQYALALADLAVARAGASFLAEAAITGLPTILIPYPYAANDHQTLNAKSFVEKKAARMLSDAQLSADSLVIQIIELLDNVEERQMMSEAALSLAKPNAIESLIDAVYGQIRGYNYE